MTNSLRVADRLSGRRRTGTFGFYQDAIRLVARGTTKTGVTKACRYDPGLNPACQEMAVHNGVGVVPVREYKPRDKAKVESIGPGKKGKSLLL